MAHGDDPALAKSLALTVALRSFLFKPEVVTRPAEAEDLECGTEANAYLVRSYRPARPRARTITGHRECEKARRWARFRQVSRQLADRRVIVVKGHLRSREVKDAVSALLFIGDDGALGPDSVWLPALPVPGLRAELQ
jgi:hypothetical protein